MKGIEVHSVHATLSQLNTVPGVIGSLLCDAEGRLLAHAFPPHFEPSMFAEASRALADGSAGLETATGAVGMVDLHYGGARIVVRPFPGAHLLFLCDPSLNLQALAISASVAVPKLGRLAGDARRHGAAPGAAAPPAGQLHQAVQRIDALIARKRLDPFKVRGAIAIRAGFALGFIDADTPDDPEKLARLQAAAAAVLGEAV